MSYMLPVTLLAKFKANAHSFKRVTSLPSLKLSFSLYATFTPDEWHAWFHLNAASPAARNTEQVNMTKILFKVGFEPSHGKEPSLQVHRLNRSAKSRLLWILIRDWILLVCFSWRYEATEDQRVNFEKRITKFTRGTSVASYLHEKQTSRIQSLYLYFNYFIKIVLFWLRNIRFLIQNTRSLFYGCHYSPLHRLMSLQRKLNVKIFLMFIVAENTGSVNIRN